MVVTFIGGFDKYGPDPELVREYERTALAALQPFKNQMATPGSKLAMLTTVDRIRDQFVAEHPEFVAVGEVDATMYAGGDVMVHAPVTTRREWAEREAREIIVNLTVAEYERGWQKRWNSMARRHRRLYRKHHARIPFHTARIFDTLGIAQQYAILKDIDFQVRHEDNPPPAMCGPNTE